MRKFLFTVALGAAIVSSSLSGPALAAMTARDTAKPLGPAIDLRAERTSDRGRLERAADDRRGGTTVRVACENGCARPAYTRE
jgi:hypothetical protein